MCLTVKKILIIDDEPSIRQVLEIHLSGAGYEVVTAEDAVTGVGLARGGVDLVICDYHLPDMTGMEVVTEIRAGSAGVPVLMISGFLDDWLLKDVASAGATELLRKPFHKATLLKAVERLLSREEERV